MPNQPLELYAPDGNAGNERIYNILNQHRGKNFVQRIMNPYIFPSLDLGNGKQGTHLMSWGEYGGSPIAYPSIIQDRDTGKLRRLEGGEAMEYAIKSGEYIPLASSDEADWFSKNYKSIWGR